MSERSPEVDLDAFGPAFEERPTPSTMPSQYEAALAAARAEHEAMVIDPPRAPKNVTPAPNYPIAVIWGSRTGGGGHVVSIVGMNADGPVLRCTCEAGILGSHDCWAMTATRRIL